MKALIDALVGAAVGWVYALASPTAPDTIPFVVVGALSFCLGGHMRRKADQKAAEKAARAKVGEHVIDMATALGQAAQEKMARERELVGNLRRNRDDVVRGIEAVYGGAPDGC